MSLDEGRKRKVKLHNWKFGGNEAHSLYRSAFEVWAAAHTIDSGEDLLLMSLALEK